MVDVGRFWLPSLFQVVSGGEHLSAAEGAEVRLGRFWLLYLLLPSFRMRWFSLDFMLLFSEMFKKEQKCFSLLQLVSDCFMSS